MLAQNFKTPTDLRITDAEFDALVKVLGMLERGELVYSWEKDPAATEFGFDMGCQYKKHPCGTLACIGGWAATIMGVDQKSYVDRYMRFDTPLNPLYWRYPVVKDRIQPAQAAIALRNYLTHGEPRWDEALTSA